MRGSFFWTACFFGLMTLVISASLAQAGTIQFEDGKGTWRSTQCAFPDVPPVPPHDPETAANDLNLRLTQHNQFATSVQSYMNCISEEARNDATGASWIVSRDAQALMKEGDARVKKSAQKLEQQKKDDAEKE